MSGQPIETCPKDGSEFLAYDPVARKFDVCMWVQPERGALIGLVSTQFDGEYGPLDDEFWESRATLWWPLPDADLAYISPETLEAIRRNANKAAEAQTRAAQEALQRVLKWL